MREDISYLNHEKGGFYDSPNNKYPLWKAFLKDRSVASVMPSSEYLCKAVSKYIDDRSGSVIELGAGNGVITKHLLETLHWSASVYALETNRDLYNALKSDPHEMRLKVFNTSAEDLERLCILQSIEPSYIVSGIPFRMINKETTGSIISQCRSVLNKNGKLIIYQTWIPGAGLFSQLQNEIEKHFIIEDTEVVLRNLPPLIVVACRPKI